MAYERVTSLDALWSGEILAASVQGQRLLLVNIDGVVHAYEDRCVHQGLPMSRGALRGGALVCSGHAWEYDACTGAGINPTCTQLRSFAVKVEHGDVFVDVEEIVAERRGT